MASVRHKHLFIEADSFLSLTRNSKPIFLFVFLKHYLVVAFVSENTGGIGVVLLWESAAPEPVSSSPRIRGSGLGVLGASVREGWMVLPFPLSPLLDPRFP